jgi:regulator of sigma E protease
VESPLSALRWLITLILLLGVLVAFDVVRYQTLLNIGIVALGLGFVIFIHELGHFLVAKWCDVHVETFSIGFGPPLPGCMWQRGETTYMLAWFPLGGYVKMVGEGTDNEEDDNDPRSFKNKTVWQRMAIISAGVVMNVILGCLCFIISYMHGVEQMPAVVGRVDAGSPAWEKGVRGGMVIEQIGNERQPYFEDLLFAVVLSEKGEDLDFVASMPGDEKPRIATHIQPRRNKGEPRPAIGIGPADSLKLAPKREGRDRDLPVAYASAAARAHPPFEFGDVIIGTTDPDNPNQVKLLDLDPRPGASGQRDYWQYRERLHQLRGQPMVIQVLRDGKGEPVNIQVPPSYHYTLGLRMHPGAVTSVRENSPATRARVVEGDQKGVQTGILPGDVIKQVEVTDAKGHVLRWALPPSEKMIPGVTEKHLDPLRLPHELEQWAASKPSSRKVTLTVLRKVGHQENSPVKLETEWEDGWELANAVPLNLTSPLPIPGLGLAYRVRNTIAGVEPNSPATKARLVNDKGEDIDGEVPSLEGAVIKAVRFFQPGKTKDDEIKPGRWTDLEKHAEQLKRPELDQWACVFWRLQGDDVKELILRIEKNGTSYIRLKAEPDPTWPQAERGIEWVQKDQRIQKADGAIQAIALGMIKTHRLIVQIYLYLRSILTGRVSYENLGGPIQIATTAYAVADYDLYRFILYLGMISVNLAVINFLPIPVLDGGHMVFLVYEKLRGKPASETVRIAATYVGLALIVSLMCFVIYLDVKRTWF